MVQPSARIRLLLSAALALVLGAALACGGDASKSATSGSVGTVAAISAATPNATVDGRASVSAGTASAPPLPTVTPAAALSATAQLSDCETGKRVRELGALIGGLDVRALLALVPTSSSQAKDAVVASLTAYELSLARFASELRTLNMAPEFRPLRDTSMVGFETIRSGISDMKTAAAAGDGRRALQIFTKNADEASGTIKQYEQANPALMKRIENTPCP